MLFSKSRIGNTLDILALMSLVSIFWVGMNYVNVNMGGVGVQVPYNTFTWAACSLFIFVAVLKVLHSGIIRLHVSFFYYVAVLALLLLPLLYTDRLFLSVENLRFAGMACGVMFLIALQQFSTKKFNLALIVILFISTFIQSLWALLQYYFIFEPSRLFYLAEQGIPYGVFQQYNVFAIYIAFGSVLALLLWSKASERGALIGAGVVGVLAINAHLIALSTAESAVISGGAAVFLYLIHLALKGCSKNWLALFLIAICIGYAFPVSLLDVRPDPDTHGRTTSIESPIRPASSETLNLERGNSSGLNVDYSAAALESENPSFDVFNSFLGTRPTIYWVSLNMLLDRPWLGFGVGSFNKQYMFHQGMFLKENPVALYEQNITHPHNEWLYWALELGLVSALGLLILPFLWWHMTRKNWIDTSALLAGLPLMLHSMLELPFYHSAVHYLGFLGILCACMSARFFYRFQIPRLSIVLILPAAVWALFRVWFFLLATFHALTQFLMFNASDRQNIDLLTSIDNPAAFQRRFEFELFQWHLSQSQRVGKISTTTLNNLIVWSYSVIQYAPMPAVYENFVAALITAKKPEAALRYAREGLLLYPKNEFLQAKLQELVLGLPQNKP